MELFSQMKTAGLKPNAICYTAAIDACGKGGQYDTAIELLSVMKAAGLQPDVIS
jgi:pentatricopeptide repeat domain-containing protein 1